MNTLTASPWDRTTKGKPQEGDRAQRSRRTLPSDIDGFAAITGDRNPLHFDAELARRSIFGRLIVQGGVTSGLLNALVAEDMPGPGTVFLEVSWKFVKAVGIGEMLTARAEIMTVRDDKPICTLLTEIVNEAGETCLSGTATTYTVPLR